jgi:hypothetical protein
MGTVSPLRVLDKLIALTTMLRPDEVRTPDSGSFRADRPPRWREDPLRADLHG